MSLQSEETKGIATIMILEVVGRPPEHLTETLNNLINQIDEEQGVTVTGKTVNEPTLMKDQKNFYTSFAEIEVEVETIFNIANLMFEYMPANIEIVSPEIIVLTNNGWNEIFNELLRKLHGYDEIARIIQTEKTILERKLRDVLEKKNEPEKESSEKKD